MTNVTASDDLLQLSSSDRQKLWETSYKEYIRETGFELTGVAYGEGTAHALQTFFFLVLIYFIFLLSSFLLLIKS